MGRIRLATLNLAQSIKQPFTLGIFTSGRCLGTWSWLPTCFDSGAPTEEKFWKGRGWCCKVLRYSIFVWNRKFAQLNPTLLWKNLKKPSCFSGHFWFARLSNCQWLSVGLGRWFFSRNKRTHFHSWDSFRVNPSRAHSYGSMVEWNLLEVIVDQPNPFFTAGICHHPEIRRTYDFQWAPKRQFTIFLLLALLTSKKPLVVSKSKEGSINLYARTTP